MTGQDFQRTFIKNNATLVQISNEIFFTQTKGAMTSLVSNASYKNEEFLHSQ